MQIQPLHHPGTLPKLRQRDFDLLLELGQSRFFTYEQIANLWFNESLDAARKRCVKLKESGLITTCETSFRRLALVMLSRPGASFLKKRGFAGSFHPSVFEEPGLATLEHELTVRDLKISWLKRAAAERHQIDEFSIRSDLLRFSTEYGTVRPDGYVRMKTQETSAPIYFFLEVDRGTESLEKLEWKVVQYWNFYCEGGFAFRMGFPRESYKRCPFRVVLVFSSP